MVEIDFGKVLDQNKSESSKINSDELTTKAAIVQVNNKIAFLITKVRKCS